MGESDEMEEVTLGRGLRRGEGRDEGGVRLKKVNNSKFVPSMHSRYATEES